MPSWVTSLLPSLLPILQSIGKFFADYMQKLTYIKQGKKEQQLDDLKQEQKNAQDVGKIDASIDGMSDAELTALLRSGKPPADSH